MRLFLCFALALSFMSVSTAHAKEGRVLSEAEKAAQEAQAVYDKMDEIIDGKGKNIKRHFRMMNTNHNIIETVKIVRTDVGNAIKKCGENNADMKPALKARYKEWNDVIDPVMTESEGHLRNMKKVQNYASVKDIDYVFKGLNKIRKDTNDQIKKIPVTTPEACEFLLEKMDETQDNLKKLLRRTLITMPMDLEDDIRSEERAADEEEKAEKK